MTDLPRSERAAEAATLRAQGLLHRQIADRMSVSRSYVASLLSDPDGSKDMARKARYGRPCAGGCGRTTDGSYGRGLAPEFCVACTRARRTPEHGTRSRYQAGCGCDACRAAATAAQRERRHSGKEPPQHGTQSGYINWGCRCEACTTAHREYEWMHPEIKQRWLAKVEGTEPPSHGTLTAYHAYRCRCDTCRTFAANYRRERKLAKALQAA